MATTPKYRDPETVPAISAYYHAPRLWVGTKPTEKEIKTALESELVKDVYRTDLSQGICVRVRRDGVFVFDCSSWEPGKTTEIPGCDWVGGQPVPKEIIEAEELAQQRAYKRIQLLTVHLACLGTAFGGGMRQDLPPQPSSFMTLAHFEQNDLLTFLDQFAPVESYAFNNLILTKTDPTCRILDTFRKRIEVPIEIIESSFNLLQEILNSSHKNILNLVELLYKSVHNFTLHQFSESLILCWAVCESLLNTMWSQYIEEKRAQANKIGMPDNATRINGNRKQRLEGIDFTASIICEMLELSDFISYDLFRNLNYIRKARNNWLHSLKDVDINDAREAIKTTRDFLSLVANIEINLQVGLTFTARFYSKDMDRLKNWP